MFSSLRKVSLMNEEQRKAARVIHEQAGAALRAMTKENKNWDPLWPEDQYKKEEEESEDG